MGTSPIRRSSIVAAVGLLEAEQKRRVDEAKALDTESKANRRASVTKAIEAFNVERDSRVGEVAEVEAATKLETVAARRSRYLYLYISFSYKSIV